MPGSPLDPLEWEKCLGQMLRYHQNISIEIRDIIGTIRKEMKQELVPVAEDRANYGKIVKKNIRAMWALEYEIEDLQAAFAKQLGDIDIENLTYDFVEDALLQSKPLQSVLLDIRVRQKAKMDDVMKEYGEKIKDLEPLTVKRPPKPEPKPETEEKKPETEEKKPETESPKPAAEEPKETPAEAQPEEPKPAEEEVVAQPEDPAPAPPPPTINEPEPAIESIPVPQEVEASA